MAGAAFFDLDKTLIEGSSALHFGRAAYRAGMVSRRQLASDAWANLRFRLHGSTDQGTDELRERILDAIAGQRAVDLARMGPDVLTGILPLIYREVLEEAYAHQDAGRAVYIVRGAPEGVAEVRARGPGRGSVAACSWWRGGSGGAGRWGTASTPATPPVRSHTARGRRSRSAS